MQPSLDFDPPPRPLPPYTGHGVSREASRDGALVASERAETECDLLRVWWLGQGRQGGTDPEACAATGFPRHVITARRADLIARNEVVGTSERRKNPDSGVRCRVWAARVWA